MKNKQVLHRTLTRFLPLSFLFLVMLFPYSEPPVAQALEVVIEDPQLFPAYTTCLNSFWYTFNNNRGHTAYLTLNANNPANSTNHGEWHPVITQSGYYKVEAYIAEHSSITWCTGQDRTINHDTSNAHYSIHHAYGETMLAFSQYPLSNQWLELGEYYFTASGNGYVSLTDLNSEPDFSTTVSFSAMRFTLTRLTRPNTYLPLVQHVVPPAVPPPGTGVFQGPGFDACHLPEISEMQTWWNQSPYEFYALYLGGESLYSDCTVASSAWVSAVHQQGWSFIPTWVGPQAPCSSWQHRMSSDPAITYQQGRQNAEEASAKAESIGLSNSQKGGTVIYYDMETYGSSANEECRQAVASFMNGWVERLHELGNFAGGYGGRYSWVTDWATIENIPDDVWAASWYTTYYDPNASTLGISWLNGMWGNHQRIRQYTGGHDETWGGVKFNIDSDVADGLVALPAQEPASDPNTSVSQSIKNAGWISGEQGWVISNHRLYWTDDQGNSWTDISPAEVELANFLPSGEAWALSSQDQGSLTLYSSSMGKNWVELALQPPTDTWYPIQLQFISPTDGWIVLKRGTSQAFNDGIILRTRDAGRTWSADNLPIASQVNFLSDDEGWMVNDTQGKAFHTIDGGLTWQDIPFKQYPLSILSVPKNATLAGWQANGLGWAVATTGSCEGEKHTSSFKCQSSSTLYQSLDGGQSWQVISLPNDQSIK